MKREWTHRRFSLFGRTNFKTEHKGKVDLNGTECTHINLYPNDSSEKTYHTIQLFIKGQTNYEIVKMLVKGREGNNTEYNIKSFKTGVSIPDGKFQFNESYYPGVELVDNRI